MSNNKLRDLEQQWQILNNTISGLQADYSHETRSEERQRIQHRLNIKIADRDIIEQDLKAHETAEKLTQLREKLTREERNGSYPQAIETAEQIRSKHPDEPRIEQKIAKLRERQAFYQPALESLGHLGVHIATLGMPLYEKLAFALHPKNKRDDLITVLLQPTQQFLDAEMPLELYQQVCAMHLSDASLETTPGLAVNYPDLVEKILSGDTALFLGTGMADLYDDPRINEQTLAQQLAEAIPYQDFQGNLATIAELYQLRQGGRKTLLDNLHQSLPQDAQRFLLYHSLAQVKQHLILVTSAYDGVLEEAFRQAGKPFVELSSIINRTQNYDIGHVVLNYSDDDKDEIVHPQEKLSTLNLLESHSIIYKIRGTCVDTAAKQLTARKDALTLSESNYLTFAENASKMVPNFIAEHLREREILFAGFRPRSWEDRLLVRTLLGHRYNSDYLCLHMGESSDLLEQAFWKKQNVEASGIDFNTLDEHLQEALS